MLSAGCLVLLIAASAASQPTGRPAFRVADLPAQVNGSQASPQIEVVTADGGVAYFVANDGLHGAELWRSDGTAAGTRLVSDAYPGPTDGVYDLVASIGPDVLFTSPDVIRTDIRLWRSDGSHVGTLPGPSLNGLDQCSEPDNLPGSLSGVAAGELFFFSLSRREGWTKPWVTDGTAGSLQALDSNRCGLAANQWAALDDLALFAAWDSNRGNSLWASDGSLQGTVQILELGHAGIRIDRELSARLGDVLLFGIKESDTYRLWRTDGTPSGTNQVFEWNHPVELPSAVGSVAYLRGAKEVWRTDGTREGTTLVAELGQTITDGFFAAEEGIMFSTVSYRPESHQLWRTDSTAAGTEMVAQLEYIGALVPLEGLVLFSCSDAGSSGICVSDGTAAGTRQLLDVSGQIVSLGPGYGALVFSWDGAMRDLLTIRHTDGSTFGTRVVREIRSQPSPVVRMYGTFDDVLLFEVMTGFRDLWVSDGTTSGTRLHTPKAYLYWQRIVGDRLVAAVKRMDTGEQELCALDEPGGVLQPLMEVGDSKLATVMGGRVFFIGDESTGDRLWSSDGTVAGMAPVGGEPLDRISDLTTFGNQVVLLGHARPDSVLALFRSDGEQIEHIVDLENLFSAELFATEQVIYVYGGSVHIQGALSEISIWRSDGTAQGTVRLEVPFTTDRYPIAMGEDLYLLGRTRETWRLWRSIGDRLTLVDDLVHEGQPAANIWQPPGPVVVNGHLFFTQHHESTGQELWVSDGTSEGTRLVRDVYPGPRGSHPSALTAVGDILLFAADNGVSGKELWVSDGSEDGTRMVTDIAPGRVAASPEHLIRVGSLVLFTATDGSTPRGLWALPLEALQVRAPEPRRPGRRTVGVARQGEPSITDGRRVLAPGREPLT